MRINNQIIARTLMQNLNRNLEMMNKSQDEMSSGKKIRRPSDDPIGMAQLLSLKSSLNQQEQYIKNMEDAKSWIDTSETALNNATNVLQRAREIAVYAANGSLPENSLEALEKEVEELINELVQIANTSYGDRYIFGGTNTQEPPFEYTGGVVLYTGDNNNLEWEISREVEMAVNINGNELFQLSGDNVFDLLINFKNDLTAGKAGEYINDLDKAFDHLLSQRATLGARSKRMEMSLQREEEAKVNLTALRSKLEDADLAESTMNFKMQEFVYQAALATAAKSIQPSLIDYLS